MEDVSQGNVLDLPDHAPEEDRETGNVDDARSFGAVRMFRIPDPFISEVSQRFEALDSSKPDQLPRRSGMNSFRAVSIRHDPGRYLSRIVYFPETIERSGSVAVLAFQKPVSEHADRNYFRVAVAVYSDLDWTEDEAMCGREVLPTCVRQLDEDHLLNEIGMDEEHWETLSGVEKNEFRRLADRMGVNHSRKDSVQLGAAVRKLLLPTDAMLMEVEG